MADSILDSTKKVLNIFPSDPAFDVDILMHINSVFSTLNQLGIGPDEGYAIEDATAEWSDFLDGDKRLNNVKSYMYIRVRLLFDPPATSFGIAALKEQAQELEWRLNVQREGESWTAPVVDPPVDPEIVIIPSSQAWYSE